MTEPKDKVITVCLIFLTVAVACGALALHYRRLLVETRAKTAAAAAAVAANQPDKAQDSSRTYTLVEQVAQKDAAIARLQRQVDQLRAGGAQAPSPAAAARAEFVQRQKARLAQAEQEAAEAPAPTPEKPRVAGSLAEHCKFFNGVDTSQMDPVQYDQHVRLVTGLTQVESLLVKMRTARDPNELAPLEQEVNRRVQELQPLLTAEKDILFYAASRGVGCDEDTARWFVDYIKYVYVLTAPDALAKSAWQSPSPQ